MTIATGAVVEDTEQTRVYGRLWVPQPSCISMSSVISLGSSLPPSPSLESMASSRPPSPFSDSATPAPQASEIVDGRLTTPITRRHAQFYFEDGNLIFSVCISLFIATILRILSVSMSQVENTLYNVHRYFFKRDSDHFHAEFQGSLAASGMGVTDENPFVLLNIKSKDFDEFLAVLYPT